MVSYLLEKWQHRSEARDLFDCVNEGDLDYIKTVKAKVLLNAINEKGISILSVAIKADKLDCCKEILKKCPSLLYIQETSDCDYTALHYAIEKRNYMMVDYFLGVGLDAATGNMVRFYQVDMFVTVASADVESKAENMQRFKNWINLKNRNKKTALFLAVEYGHHDIVKKFLEVDRQYKLGLSEIPDGSEKTPLQLALEKEDQGMIKLLKEGTDRDLEHGANNDGNMSLLIATSQTKEALYTGNNRDSAGTDPEFEYGASTQTQEALQSNSIDPDFKYGALTDGKMPHSIPATQAQEPLHTGNNSDSAGTDPDFKYGANTDGNMSHSIAATQAQEALHTGNNSDSAGMDATNDCEKVHLTKFLNDLESEKPQRYSLAQLMNFTNKFSDPVGSGGFGKVYKGEFPDGVQIAVKVLKNSQPELMVKQFKAELSTTGRTYHRNLIKLYGYCNEADTTALVYEYMEKGDLDVILKKNNLDMVKLYTIATEISRGISYLHESCNPQIIHNDLKPANVLLDSKFSPRVIDFGLARLNMDKSQLAQSRMRGTFGYVAPEIIALGSGPISCKCDVYSFGMILFDILKSKINYVDQRWLPGQVWEKVKEGELANFLRDHVIKEDDNTDAKTLSMVALLCDEFKPQNRPSMSDVVKMLEGRMTPNPPIDPFPHYNSSNDRSTYDLSY